MMANKRITRRMKRPMTLVALLMAFSLLVAACGDDGPEAEGTVRLAFEEFLDTEVANALADTVLTDLGYTVEWTSLDIGLIYQSIVNEDLDVYVGGWLPTGQADYWNVHGQDLERLGPLHNEALLGSCVPQTETDVNSWEDLADPAVAERFDNVIVGHFAGSATMLRTDDAIQNYGLDFDLLESSVAAMMAEVTPKLDAGEPVAWVCWYPMWWWARWDIKFLEDPTGGLSRSRRRLQHRAPGLQGRARHGSGLLLLQQRSALGGRAERVDAAGRRGRQRLCRGAPRMGRRQPRPRRGVDVGLLAGQRSATEPSPTEVIDG